MPPKKEFKSIDDYISNFPRNVQVILQQFRQTVHEAAPEAQEAISYQMPAFKQRRLSMVCRAQKPHWVLPSGVGHRGIQGQANPVRCKQRYGPISIGRTGSF